MLMNNDIKEYYSNANDRIMILNNTTAMLNEQ